MSFLGTYAQPFGPASGSVQPDPSYPPAFFPGTGRFDPRCSPDTPYFVAWSFPGTHPPAEYGNPTPLVGSPEQSGPTELPLLRTGKRRVTANRKERRRTLSINNAFAELRECIPNVPSDTKLSKIKTLRLATSYIAYLMDILAQGEPGSGPQLDFKAELLKAAAPREDRRKQDIATLVAGMSNERKAKGRTGWPQHVWALELKHDSSATT